MYDNIPTPCYVVDERLLIKNLEVLKQVKERSGAKILLAQKGFSMFYFYPLISRYLDGTTASSLFEARLGYEKMGGETHIFSPAYPENDFPEIASICGHIVFNTPAQYEKYKNLLNNSSAGLRINPEYSETSPEIYDPCAKNSRLGTTLCNLPDSLPPGLEGLHFHTMCEQNSDVLARTLDVVEEKFAKYLSSVKWINFGGGHHITRKDYDIETLVSCIIRIKERYGLEVYLEPGEAIALNTGFLVSTVLDTHNNGMNIAITDVSAACHMPDVLEMPYRPHIINAGLPGEKPYAFRLGGNTCLAGDIIGDYSFDALLKAGDRLVFCDMAHYTMVKNNTFNGVNLPSIAVCDRDGKTHVIKKFVYEDFTGRLS